jgi:hypothetical protein
MKIKSYSFTLTWISRDKYNFAFWQLQWAFSFKICKRDLEHAWCVAIAKLVPHYGPLSYFLIFREHTTSTLVFYYLSKIMKIKSYSFTLTWISRYQILFWYLTIFFIAFFSAIIDGRNLIFGHKLHIGTPYRGKRFWTRHIPTSCTYIYLTCMHSFFSELTSLPRRKDIILQINY